MAGGGGMMPAMVCATSLMSRQARRIAAAVARATGGGQG
jgi:hypothetical protein